MPKTEDKNDLMDFAEGDPFEAHRQAIEDEGVKTSATLVRIFFALLKAAGFVGVVGAMVVGIFLAARYGGRWGKQMGWLITPLAVVAAAFFVRIGPNMLQYKALKRLVAWAKERFRFTSLSGSGSSAAIPGSLLGPAKGERERNAGEADER